MLSSRTTYPQTFGPRDIIGIMVMALLGLIMIGGYYRESELYHRLSREGQQTEATIISRTEPDSGRHFYLEYSFMVRNSEYSYTQQMSKELFERFLNRSSVTILYDPVDPSISRIKEGAPPLLGPSSMLLCGVLFVLCSIFWCLHYKVLGYEWRSGRVRHIRTLPYNHSD
jgi:hypothetical protein